MDVRDDSSSSSRGVLPTGTRKTSLPTVALAGTSSYSPLSSGVDRSPATFTTTQRSMTRRGRSTLTPAGSERAPYAAQPVAMRRSPARRPTLRCRPRRRGLSPSLPGTDRVSSAISRSTSSSPASRAGSTAFQRRTRRLVFSGLERLPRAKADASGDGPGRARSALQIGTFSGPVCAPVYAVQGCFSGATGPNGAGRWRVACASVRLGRWA